MVTSKTVYPSKQRIQIRKKKMAASKDIHSTGTRGLCSPLKCTGCCKRIRSRFFVTFQNSAWHENCLKCDVCDEILFSFGSGKCYCREGKKLCKMDYLRLYGKSGVCSMCDDVINSTDKVMRFKEFTYHEYCFNCSICKRYFQRGEHVVIKHQKSIICTLHDTDAVHSACRSHDTEYVQSADALRMHEPESFYTADI